MQGKYNWVSYAKSVEMIVVFHVYLSFFIQQAQLHTLFTQVIPPVNVVPKFNVSISFIFVLHLQYYGP